MFHPIFQVIDQNGYTYGLAPRYTASLDLGGLRNDVIVGGRFFGGNNIALQYLNIGGSRGAQTVNSRQNATNIQGYAENRLFLLPDIAWVVGAKLFHDTRNYVNFGALPPFSTVYQNSTTNYDGIAPRMGVLWQPKPDIQGWVNITKSFDVPDFSDLTQARFDGLPKFVPLQAQNAWTLEIGTRGKHGPLAWDITLYNAWVQDQMLQFTTNPNVPASTFNAGSTTMRGVELGVSLDVLKDLATRGDILNVAQLWNYSNFFFNNDPQYGNNKLAGIPPNLLRTTVTYTHPSGFYVAPGIDWVPTGAWIDYANTQRVPGYVLVGLQAGIAFDNGVSVYLDARNLANKRYISDFGTVTRYSPTLTQTFYPGDGRSVYAGTRVLF